MISMDIDSHIFPLTSNSSDISEHDILDDGGLPSHRRGGEASSSHTQSDMTEDEVNQMVQEALLRARQAMQSRGQQQSPDNTSPPEATSAANILGKLAMDNRRGLNDDDSSNDVSNGDNDEGANENDDPDDLTSDSSTSTIDIHNGTAFDDESHITDSQDVGNSDIDITSDYKDYMNSDDDPSITPRSSACVSVTEEDYIELERLAAEEANRTVEEALEEALSFAVDQNDIDIGTRSGRVEKEAEEALRIAGEMKQKIFMMRDDDSFEGEDYYTKNNDGDSDEDDNISSPDDLDASGLRLDDKSQMDDRNAKDNFEKDTSRKEENAADESSQNHTTQQDDSSAASSQEQMIRSDLDAEAKEVAANIRRMVNEVKEDEKSTTVVKDDDPLEPEVLTEAKRVAKEVLLMANEAKEESQMEMYNANSSLELEDMPEIKTDDDGLDNANDISSKEATRHSQIDINNVRDSSDSQLKQNVAEPLEISLVNQNEIEHLETEIDKAMLTISDEDKTHIGGMAVQAAVQNDLAGDNESHDSREELPFDTSDNTEDAERVVDEVCRMADDIKGEISRELYDCQLDSPRKESGSDTRRTPFGNDHETATMDDEFIENPNSTFDSQGVLKDSDDHNDETTEENEEPNNDQIKALEHAAITEAKKVAKEVRRMADEAKELMQRCVDEKTVTSPKNGSFAENISDGFDVEKESIEAEKNEDRTHSLSLACADENEQHEDVDVRSFEKDPVENEPNLVKDDVVGETCTDSISTSIEDGNAIKEVAEIKAVEEKVAGKDDDQQINESTELDRSNCVDVSVIFSDDDSFKDALEHLEAECQEEVRTKEARDKRHQINADEDASSDCVDSGLKIADLGKLGVPCSPKQSEELSDTNSLEGDIMSRVRNYEKKIVTASKDVQCSISDVTGIPGRVNVKELLESWKQYEANLPTDKDENSETNDKISDSGMDSDVQDTDDRSEESDDCKNTTLKHSANTQIGAELSQEEDEVVSNEDNVHDDPNGENVNEHDSCEDNVEDVENLYDLVNKPDITDLETERSNIDTGDEEKDAEGQIDSTVEEHAEEEVSSVRDNMQEDMCSGVSREEQSDKIKLSSDIDSSLANTKADDSTKDNTISEVTDETDEHYSPNKIDSDQNVASPLNNEPDLKVNENILEETSESYPENNTFDITGQLSQHVNSQMLKNDHMATNTDNEKLSSKSAICQDDTTDADGNEPVTIASAILAESCEGKKSSDLFKLTTHAENENGWTDHISNNELDNFPDEGFVEFAGNKGPTDFNNSSPVSDTPENTETKIENVDSKPSWTSFDGNDFSFSKKDEDNKEYQRTIVKESDDVIERHSIGDDHFEQNDFVNVFDDQMIHDQFGDKAVEPMNEITTSGDSRSVEENLTEDVEDESDDDGSDDYNKKPIEKYDSFQRVMSLDEQEELAALAEARKIAQQVRSLANANAISPRGPFNTATNNHGNIDKTNRALHPVIEQDVEHVTKDGSRELTERDSVAPVAQEPNNFKDDTTESGTEPEFGAIFSKYDDPPDASTVENRSNNFTFDENINVETTHRHKDENESDISEEEDSVYTQETLTESCSEYTEETISDDDVSTKLAEGIIVDGSSPAIISDDEAENDRHTNDDLKYNESKLKQIDTVPRMFTETNLKQGSNDLTNGTGKDGKNINDAEAKFVATDNGVVDSDVSGWANVEGSNVFRSMAESGFSGGDDSSWWKAENSEVTEKKVDPWWTQDEDMAKDDENARKLQQEDIKHTQETKITKHWWSDEGIANDKSNSKLVPQDIMGSEITIKNKNRGVPSQPESPLSNNTGNRWWNNENTTSKDKKTGDPSSCSKTQSSTNAESPINFSPVDIVTANLDPCESLSQLGDVASESFVTANMEHSMENSEILSHKSEVASESSLNQTSVTPLVTDAPDKGARVSDALSSPSKSARSELDISATSSPERSLVPSGENQDEEQSLSSEMQIVPHVRAIEFRNPYPLPPPPVRPRSPNTIVQEHIKHAPPLAIKWKPPSPQLAELLKAARGPSIARRSNACGALKVLSSKKDNQMKLARTQGLFDALVFAANESPPSYDSDAAFDARTRAVTTILYLSALVENRVLVFSHKGVPECLVKVMREDCGEARVNACSALAFMAKTIENRERMVHIPDLVSVVALVVEGKGDGSEKVDMEETNNEERLCLYDESQQSFVDPAEQSVGHNSSVQMDDSTYQSNCDNSTYRDDSTKASSMSYGMSFDDDGGRYSPNRKGKYQLVPYNRGRRVEQNNSNTRLDKNMSLNDTRKIHFEKLDEYLATARLNSCAILSHLVKYCPVSEILSQHEILLDTLVSVSQEFSSPVHTRCIEIISHLTRLSVNNASLSRKETLIDALIKCGKSKLLEDRVWALRALQNLTSDESSKILLATPSLLTMLSVSAMRKDEEEQLAATSALLNLSSEPGTIVPLTNTKNVVATLVHLAHSPNSLYDVRRMACDALATIGLWLQTLAGAGTVPEGVDKVLLPSHTATGWQRWD